VSLYRPPAGNKNLFVEHLSNWLTNLRNYDVYIAGDFNINWLNSDREFYINIESNTGLNPKISEITRVASGSSIDNILTNLDGTHKVSTICIADHQGLFSSVKIKHKKKKKS
jgi:hypothetical protein